MDKEAIIIQTTPVLIIQTIAALILNPKKFVEIDNKPDHVILEVDVIFLMVINQIQDQSQYQIHLIKKVFAFIIKKEFANL